MAKKLNSQALVDSSIVESKLSSDVRTKLNRAAGVPEAPTDGKQYVRQNSDWAEINLSSVLSRLDALETANTQLSARVAALESDMSDITITE